eukprot:scaffold135139_cov18-Tisochrysis_lutea.AAC.1
MPFPHSQVPLKLRPLLSLPIQPTVASAAKTASLWELLNNPEQDGTIFGNRARSATDANVLRRKGHLK